MLRGLLDHVAARDVILADALLATGWIIEGVLARGGDVVMAQHGCRITNFTRGERLGKHDHMVEWPRPPRPATMSVAQYQSYPECIRMRGVEVDGRILVTTLLDPKAVSGKALDALYAMRWNIEVDFRTIKRRCKWMCCAANQRR